MANETQQQEQQEEKEDSEKWLNSQFSERLHSRTKLSPEEKQDYIKSLYDKYGTIRLAAKQIDVSPSTIVRHLHGWKRRREMNENEPPIDFDVTK